MPLLSLNAVEMYYEHHRCDSNSQVPLLMLSGMASDSASWLPVIPQLSTQHELLIPDNRCCGRTRPNPIQSSRREMVDDLIALLDALGIDRVNILGHSMGGMLGWALACKAPNRVKHLICASAVATVIPARIALFETLSGLRNDSNEAQWFELLYQFLFSPSFFVNSATVKQAVKNSLAYPYKQDQHSFTTQVSGLASFIEPLNLDAIQCPVSLITGANDLLMTKSLLQSFCQEHKYRFTILPDAAHALHWEQTDAFAHYVLNELKPQQA